MVYLFATWLKGTWQVINGSVSLVGCRRFRKSERANVRTNVRIDKCRRTNVRITGSYDTDELKFNECEYALF